MNPIKAPRSDSLPAIFYQRYWNMVGKYVTNVCLNVLNNRASMEKINNTIISLILKVPNLRRITEYRPISLCNVIYKAIAKATTKRLKHVLGRIISETQCVFVPGRLITDNTIVSFECIHGLKRRKRKWRSMAIKLDMAKAYDMVEWPFSGGDDTENRILGEMGFAPGFGREPKKTKEGFIGAPGKRCADLKLKEVWASMTWKPLIKLSSPSNVGEFSKIPTLLLPRFAKFVISRIGIS
ncbi:hypothetical protein Ddye_002067 [Dipteronia dyeriana]|uniref:Reverse transcriptase domain-containing protein n=1 Tax=Dipteronia dyeriana TaxID=168575 RepID=A0AAE0CUL8_9ROSI|nr:hypothetical protein Ddye_002067 [Dipteronia dyeriana]